NTTEWYMSLFPDIQPSLFSGEASTLYLTIEDTEEYIKMYLPNVKLIVLVRNPVDMIESLYFYFGYDVGNENGFIKFFNERHEKDTGVYVKYLKRYREYFDENQLRVINSEKFFHNPKQILLELGDYIGLRSNGWIFPDEFPIIYQRSNKSIFRSFSFFI